MDNEIDRQALSKDAKKEKYRQIQKSLFSYQYLIHTYLMVLFTLLICSFFSYDELHTIDPAGSRGFFQVTTVFFPKLASLPGDLTKCSPD